MKNSAANVNSPLITRDISRRSILRGSLALGGVAAAGSILAACGGGSTKTNASPAPLKADGDITLFMNAAYISKDVLATFKSQHGVNVKQVFYSDQDEAVKKLASGGAYDVVVLNTTNLPRAINAGLLRPVATDKFEHADQLSSYFQNPAYDPGARYSVPYAVGAAGLQYRTDKVNNLTGSWSDMWNVKEADGHSYVLKDAATAMGMALLYIGEDPGSSEEKAIDKAAEALIELKPRLGGISSDTATNQNGQSWLSQSWGGNSLIYLNTPGAQPVSFRTCKEGALFSADVWSVAAKSQHAGSASLFLDWMLKPETVRSNTAAIGYPVPTPAGLEAFKTLASKYPFVAVDPELINDDSQWIKALTGDRLRYLTTAWNKVLAA